MNLHEYFQAVDRHLADAFPCRHIADFYIIGRRLRFVFGELDQMLLMKERMKCPFTGDQDTEVDATFYYFRDDLSFYLPARQSASTENCVYQSSDATGKLSIVTHSGVTGADLVLRSFYFIRDCGWKDHDAFNGHPMIGLLSDWALSSDLLVLHSACVGVEGKGVLLGAWGGGGKSTLSVSCLLRDDMQFISDDYTLVSAHGPLTAYPMYTFVSLNQDMHQRINDTLPVIKVLEERGGKLQLDASVRPFAGHMPLKAIVAPRITHQKVPHITPCKDQAVKVRIITSSVRQIGHNRDADLVRQLALRLKDLPVFEIGLSEDLKANSSCLKEFIEKF